MFRKSLFFVLVIILLYCNNITFGRTFGEYATDAGLTGNETYINASWKNLTGLEGLANNYDYLQALNIRENQITNAVDGCFYGLGNLQTLDFTHNHMTAIASGTFNGLDNLQTLNLCCNELTSLESGDFSGLANLKTLYFDVNKITSIESDDFEGLDSLQRLGLPYNQLTSIDSGDFNKLNNLKILNLRYNQITSIESGDFEGLGNLQTLDLSFNDIASIESGSFVGLNNLMSLSLAVNRISLLDLSGANFLNLESFSVESNPLEEVILSDALLNQTSFNAIMNAGLFSYRLGIAEISGVMSLDFSRVDFTDILDLSEMNTMDDLETLIFANTTNLDGDEVVKLLSELNSLNYLDVTGSFYGWDSGIQDQLIAWDNVEGNTLVIPEPMTLMLLTFGGLALRKRR